MPHNFLKNTTQGNGLINELKELEKEINTFSLCSVTHF